MKVNLDQQFKTMDGKEMPSSTPNMRMSIAQNLFNGHGVGNTQDEKFAAYKLCNRLMNEPGELELDKDERKLILASSCANLTPGAFGQIMDLLNTKE